MRLYLRSRDRRPDPPPLPTDDRGTILVGMAVWAVLWVAALVLRSRLQAAGHGWWIWTPPSALALGLFGLWYLHRRERHAVSAPPAASRGSESAERLVDDGKGE